MLTLTPVVVVELLWASGVCKWCPSLFSLPLLSHKMSLGHVKFRLVQCLAGTSGCRGYVDVPYREGTTSWGAMCEGMEYRLNKYLRFNPPLDPAQCYIAVHAIAFHKGQNPKAVVVSRDSKRTICGVSCADCYFALYRKSGSSSSMERPMPRDHMGLTINQLSSSDDADAFQTLEVYMCGRKYRVKYALEETIGDILSRIEKLQDGFRVSWALDQQSGATILPCEHAANTLCFVTMFAVEGAGTIPTDCIQWEGSCAEDSGGEWCEVEATEKGDGISQRILCISDSESTSPARDSQTPLLPLPPRDEDSSSTVSLSTTTRHKRSREV